MRIPVGRSPFPTFVIVPNGPCTDEIYATAMGEILTYAYPGAEVGVTVVCLAVRDVELVKERGIEEEFGRRVLSETDKVEACGDIVPEQMLGGTV